MYYVEVSDRICVVYICRTNSLEKTLIRTYCIGQIHTLVGKLPLTATGITCTTLFLGLFLDSRPKLFCNLFYLEGIAP